MESKTDASCSPQIKKILEANHDLGFVPFIPFNNEQNDSAAAPLLLKKHSSLPLKIPESPCHSITDFSNFYRPKPIKFIPTKILENSFLDLQGKGSQGACFKASLASQFQSVPPSKPSKAIL